MRSTAKKAPARGVLTPQEQWLMQVRGLILDGKLGDLQKELEAAAVDRPLDALAAVRELMDLRSLEGDRPEPGLDLTSVASEAARHLAWAAPESSRALNGVLSPGQPIFEAWNIYLALQQEQRAPEEIYAEAQKVSRDVQGGIAIYTGWMQAAARKNPQGVMPLLHGPARDDEKLWVAFFDGIAMERPDATQFTALLEQLPHEPQDRYCTSQAVNAWLAAHPDMASLSLVAQKISLRTAGYADGQDLPPNYYARPEEREALLGLVKEQPPADRADLVVRLSASEGLTISELLPLLELAPSLESQKQAVMRWVKANNERYRYGYPWLKELPSVRLQQAVKEELDR